MAFQDAAWEVPEARWIAGVVASLLETKVRLEPGAAPGGSDEVVAYVGAVDSAPADADVVLAAEGWPEWRADALALADVDGVPLPCPGGRLGGSPDPRVLPAEWLRGLHALASREEEYQDSRRDPWECFSGTQTRLHALGVLQWPLLHEHAAALERRLAAAARARGAALDPVPRWPDGHRFAAVLTHDVDDISLYSWRSALRLIARASSPRSYAVRGGLHALWRAARRPSGADPFWNFERWMTAEQEHGVRSAFYIVPPATRAHELDPAYRLDDVIGFEGRSVPFASVLRAMVERGHEVGLHGSYLSHRSAAELARQRAAVAGAAGASVVGVRQHFLRFDVRSTWRAQAEAGFAYDATLGYNEALGFRAGIGAPFRPWDAERRAPHALWELPLTAMDGTLFRTLRLDERAATEAVTDHLGVIERAGACAGLLWHPNAAAERAFPGWWAPYVAALDALRARNAWVETPERVIAWWTDRARRQGE